MINFFFGDKNTAFEKEQFYGVKNSQELLHHIFLNKVYELQRAEVLLTVHQTHSIRGLVITKPEQACEYEPYSQEADYLITNVPHIALGVATADCLPIIFYDKKKKVIAIAHAGWQGSVAGIASKVAEILNQEFGCAYGDMCIIFGPCATVNAYEVSADFEKNIVDLGKKQREEVFMKKNGSYYFNLPLYNQRCLEQYGVCNFNYEHNHCTITNYDFCSYRREGKLAKRQMSVVVLN